MAIAALDPTVKSSQVSDVDPNRDKLGRDDFLKMFITQMQHQDPLNPLEGTEFTSQLAQFSSLEQLFNLNENTEDLVESQEALGRMQALRLMDKEILTEGNALHLEEETTVKGSFLLPEGVSRCSVAIYDEEGGLVRTLDLGALDAGEQDFSWDGLDAKGQPLPAGSYHYQIHAENLAGDEVAAETRTSGVVTGVKLEGLIPLLCLGKVEIPLTQVIEVRSPGLISAEASDLS